MKQNQIKKFNEEATDRLIRMMPGMFWHIQNNKLYLFIKEMEKLLKKGADINVKDDKNWATPLMYAVERKHPQLLNFFIRNGADVNTTNRASQSALEFAIDRGGDNDILNILIQNGADVNRKSNKGRTPLMRATKLGRFDIVKKLILAGADAEAVDKEGVNALKIAELNDFKEIYELLSNFRYLKTLRRRLDFLEKEYKKVKAENKKLNDKNIELTKDNLKLENLFIEIAR